MIVTVTVTGQFTIEANNESNYQKQLDAMLSKCEEGGIPLGVESEDTDDGRWFDDEGD